MGGGFFEDEDLRIPHSPLLSQETWQILLQEEGFVSIQILGSAALCDSNTAQVVIAARSDGILRIEESSEPHNGKPSRVNGSSGPAFPTTIVTERNAIATEPLGDRDQKLRHLEVVVVQCLGQILQTSPSELEPGLPLSITAWTPYLRLKSLLESMRRWD